MKFITSALVGATLVASSLGFADTASARSDVGVYVGPGGVGISVETYRQYCRDEGYRRHHWDRCSRFYGNGYYYPNAYRYDRDRYHHRHRHWNREYRRWDWD